MLVILELKFLNDTNVSLNQNIQNLEINFESKKIINKNLELNENCVNSNNIQIMNPNIIEFSKENIFEDIDMEIPDQDFILDNDFFKFNKSSKKSEFNQIGALKTRNHEKLSRYFFEH